MLILSRRTDKLTISTLKALILAAALVLSSIAEQMIKSRTDLINGLFSIFFPPLATHLQNYTESIRISDKKKVDETRKVKVRIKFPRDLALLDEVTVGLSLTDLTRGHVTLI